jgi:protein-disulfide isomerase
MTIKRTMLAGLVVWTGALSLFAADAANKPVATIGDTAISQTELERAVGSRLTRIRTEEYTVRRAVLDDMVATRLLDAEAARRHINVEELIKTEVDAKIVEPKRTDLEPVYEGISDRFPGQTKEQAIEQIADGMRRQRIADRRAELIKQLRAAAGVKINLEPPRVAVKAEGPSRGNADAPVTIVEFSDFECPFCSRAAATLQQIEKVYGNEIRLVFRDYPLASHHTAKRAAEAAHCADDQGKFWEMHERMFGKGGGPITDGDIDRFAAQIKLVPEQFASCLASGKYKDAFRASQEEGYHAGVISTPSFFINGRMVIGAAPFETFANVIDEELERAGIAPDRVRQPKVVEAERSR